KIAKTLRPEQNTNMYSALSVKNRILKKQLEDYHSQLNTLERRVKRLKKDVRSLKDELKDLDEYVNRKTFLFFIKTPIRIRAGDDSIKDFYKKYKKYIKLSRWDKSQNKNQFICELSSANQFKVRLCGLDLPLDELVDRLVKLEA
ncbi:7767_t:CDS:2, partial [Funneliformis geosporum]